MPNLSMPRIDELRETLGEPVKDLKLNLASIAQSEYLDAEQIWGVALASAYFIGAERLTAALLEDAKTGGATEALLEDAQSVAAIMGMNTIYYRFRHLVHKESYGKRPARLRMQAMAKPKTSKATFELMSLAIAALAGCETCIQSHEQSVQQHGLSEEHVHDAVRIAAILQGAAVALRT